MSQLFVGNAHEEGANQNGWFIGHFLPVGELQSSPDVEVKWGVHSAGESKTGWTCARQATTVSILLRGTFHIHFADRDVVLRNEGDYVLWHAGVFHTWFAEQESVVITIRWPSRSGDVVTADEVMASELRRRR